MSDKQKTIKKEVEDTMACSAYAEAGEPCPIPGHEKQGKTKTAGKKTKKAEKSTLESIKDTMACSAYAEAGEPCPIDKKEKK